MTEDEWFTATNTEKLLERVAGFTSDRKLRLFTAGWCRRCWEPITDPHLTRAVEYAERYADGFVNRAITDEVVGELRQELSQRAELDERTVWILMTDTEYIHTAIGFCRLSGGWDPSDVHPVDRDCFLKDLAERNAMLRDIVGNPFRSVAFSPVWRTSTAIALARQMYESRDFSAMPILADALQDAGCDSEDILTHCRDSQAVHVRGCWVVDLVLGKA